VNGRRIADSEPCPVPLKRVAGLLGNGGYAVKHQELLQVLGKSRHRTWRGEFGKSQRDRIVKQGDARTVDVLKEFGQMTHDGRSENLRRNESVERTLQRVEPGFAQPPAKSAAPDCALRPAGSAFFAAATVRKIRKLPWFQFPPRAQEGISRDGFSDASEMLMQRSRHALDSGARASVARMAQIEEQHRVIPPAF
jgi:hypothetical protein